jgi:hypothetical protein
MEEFKTISTGANGTPILQVCSPAVLLLPIAGYRELRAWSGTNWDHSQTKFCEQCPLCSYIRNDTHTHTKHRHFKTRFALKKERGMSEKNVGYKITKFLIRPERLQY